MIALLGNQFALLVAITMLILLSFKLACALVAMPKLVALQTAMTRAEPIVVSRGDGDQVRARQLQSLVEELEDKLEVVLAAGLPDGDRVVSDAKKLKSTLFEMRIEVRQRDSLTQRYYCMLGAPTHIHN